MDVVGNRTLGSLLFEKAELYPDKPFLLFEDSTFRQTVLTYEAFANKVALLSQGLANLGIKKGDRVTLHLQNSPEFMIAWFALTNMGAVMVPTNILSTAREMEYILRHSESVLLVTDEEHLGKLKPLQENLPNLHSILVTRSSGTAHGMMDLQMLIDQSSVGQLESPKSEDIAAILYTSGTTSQPKGVLVTHANYLFAGEVMSKSIRLGPDDRQLIVLPLFHGNAQYYSSMSALTVGASIALTERFSASRYFKQAKQFHATVGSLFAAPIRMILAQTYDVADRENNMRVIWFAQSISKTQLEEFESKFDTRLLQLYGMTETMATPIMNPYDALPNNLSIGRPVLGYEAKVIDETGAEVANGTVGQLVIKGEPGRTIMKGYFNNPSATEDTIQDGWLYTGDNARVDEHGYFHFVDRIKDMIKRSGENVAACEVEQVLAQHPAVYDCAVIGIPDTIRDESIKAYVILRPGYRSDFDRPGYTLGCVLENELISFCQSRLAKFKVPEVIEFVTDLPRTSVGKIQKHILRKQSAIAAAKEVN
jgi:carnitine-CoA ligase